MQLAEPLRRRELWHPRHWPAWLAIAITWVLSLLPFRVLSLLGGGLGWVGYHLAGKRRDVARRNMALCLRDLDEGERERVLKQHFGHLATAALCQGLSWFASRERIGRIVRIRNRETIDGLINEGRPVIVLVPHFVGLELGGTAFTSLVHPGAYMYQRIRNPVIDAWVRHGRTRFGSIPVERQDDLRGLVRTIRSGTPFFYLPDQDGGRRRGIFVPFCGVPASTVPMLGRFAHLGRAAVIPTFARFLPRGEGLELWFDPPMEGFPTGDAEADTRSMNAIIEDRIACMPDQYFWVHRRFKTRPLGEGPIYAERRPHR